MLRELLAIMQQRHSCRVPYDMQRPVSDADLRQILEAARWAPTAHNMQNFELVFVDDRMVLDAIRAIEPVPSATFLRENYQQLSFSEDELLRKATGVLANMFPRSWQNPVVWSSEMPETSDALPGRPMPSCPALLVAVFDTRKRAPASDGDVLGHMSLGCVLQNLWLMAHAKGIALQVLSSFSAGHAHDEMRRILDIPSCMNIAFVCRLGYPHTPPDRYLRVRRRLEEFVHRNRYGSAWI